MYSIGILYLSHAIYSALVCYIFIKLFEVKFYLNIVAGYSIGLKCREYDLRLFNSEGSLLEGRVELCIQQVWRSVCDYLWDDLDAQVVCRQLGYSAIGMTS